MDNISNFAENLILNEVKQVTEGKVLPPSVRPQSGLAPAGRDISRTQVPDSFMKEILGEAFTPQETPPVDAIPELVWTDPSEEVPEQEPQQSMQSLTEETAQQLVPLLEEVKSLIKEMTAAMTGSGNIGVRLGGTKTDDESWDEIEQQGGYGKKMKSRLGINLPSCKSKLPGDSRKRVLKNAISAKLKKGKG